MYFKNEKAEIEILIGGYTDVPQRYDDKIIRKNALACQVYFYGEDLGDGVLWDDLFQTDDIIRLHCMAVELASGNVDSFSYKDQWDMVLIDAKRNADDYDISVSVIQRSRGNSYLSGKFTYSKQDFMKLIEELEKYKKSYPVRKCRISFSHLFGK